MNVLTRCLSVTSILSVCACFVLAEDVALPPGPASKSDADAQPEPPPPPKPAKAPAPEQPAPPEPREPNPPPPPQPPREELPPDRLTADEQRELDSFAHVIGDRLSVDPNLQANRVTGWRIVRPSDDLRRLELDVIVYNDRQAEAIEQLVRNELARSAYWAKTEPPLTDVVVTTRVRNPPRPGMASRYFDIATKAMRCCDPNTARTAFQAALEEETDPIRREALNYWIVLTDIQLGRRDLVQERLTWLLETDPLGSSSPRIAAELERVQGPMRTALLGAERDALLARVRTNNTLQPTPIPVPPSPASPPPPATR